MFALLLAACVAADPALPQGALARVGSPAFRFPGEAEEIIYSPDGKLAAAVEAYTGGPRHVHVWRAHDGSPVAGFDLNDDCGADVEFAADGKSLIAGRGVGRGRPTLILERLTWDGRVHPLARRQLTDDPSGYWGTFLGPDRMIIIEARRVRSLALPSGKPVSSWAADGSVGLRAFCPRRKLVAVGPISGTGRGSVIDTEAGKRLLTFPARGRRDAPIFFSPDGRWMLTAPARGGAEPLKLYDVKARKLAASIPVGDATALFPDGRVAVLRGADIEVHGAGGDRLAKFAAGGVQSLRAGLAGKRLIAWAPDPAGGAGKVLIFRPSDGRRLHEVAVDAEPVTGVTVSRQPGQLRPGTPDFLMKRADGAGLLAIDLAAGKLRTPRDPVGVVDQVRFLDDRRLAVFGPRQVDIADWKAGRRLERFGTDRATWPQATGDAAGPRVAALASGNQIGVGLVGENLFARRLNPWGDPAMLAFLRVKRIAAGDGRVFISAQFPNARSAALGVWERAWSERPRWRVLLPRADRRAELIASPSGRYVIEAEPSSTPTLHDTLRRKAGELRTELPGQSRSDAAFSPDGRTAVIAAAGPRDGFLWAVEAAERKIAAGPFACAGASRVTVSPDGRTVAYFTADHTLVLRDVLTGKTLARRRGHDAAPRAAFSPSGKLVATADGVAPAFVWGVPQSKAGRPLTAADLQRCWATLDGDDSAAAYRAMRELAGDPTRAVPFLAGRLGGSPGEENLDLAERLFTDLNDDRAAVRRKATAKLIAIGTPAVRAMLRGRLKSAAPEAARRARLILGRLATVDPVPRRDRRALQAIEWAGGEAALRGLRAVKRADLADEVAKALRRVEARTAAGRHPQR